MSEREAFLAAILANPEDDTPRLVFADWLDENGEAERAEFIRVQCALARPAGVRGVPLQYHSSASELRRRERELKSRLRLRLWSGEEYARKSTSGPGRPALLTTTEDYGTPTGD